MGVIPGAPVPDVDQSVDTVCDSVTQLTWKPDWTEDPTVLNYAWHYTGFTIYYIFGWTAFRLIIMEIYQWVFRPVLTCCGLVEPLPPMAEVKAKKPARHGFIEWWRGLL